MMADAVILPYTSVVLPPPPPVAPKISTDAAPVDVAVREPDTVIVSTPVNPPTVSDAAVAVPPVDEVNGGMVGNTPLFGSVNVVAKLKVFDPKLGTVSGGYGLEDELDPDGGVK
jgi:hypothetical protein